MLAFDDTLFSVLPMMPTSELPEHKAAYFVKVSMTLSSFARSVSFSIA